MYNNLHPPTEENYSHARQPADLHMDPSLEHAHIDLSQGPFSKFMSLFNPINPFAKRFAPTKEGHSFFQPRNEGRNFLQDPYTWREILSKHNYGPKHLDPTEDAHPEYIKSIGTFQTHTGVGATYQMSKPELPHICHVRHKDVKRCRMVNENDDGRCVPEIEGLLQECPNFALKIMNRMKNFNSRVKNIQRKEYKEAMQVSDYNKGRTMGDLESGAKYSDGSSYNLRPDTMWADDRYVGVTQEEVDGAVKRMEAKNGKLDFKDLKEPYKLPADRAYYGGRSHHH